MKRKGLWAVAVVLACAAFVQLTIAASQPALQLTEKDHKDRIAGKRQALERWLNEGVGDIQDVAGENAMTVDEKGRAVGQGRAALGNKWKKIVASGRKIKFQITQILILPASFMRHEAGATWTEYDLVAVEFGTFSFSGSEAEGGPSAGLPPGGGEYWAVWEHKDDCTWWIGFEVGG